MTQSAESSFEWFRSLRTLLYDAYWPPFHPKLDYDPAKGVRVAKEMNANAIRFGSIGKWALYQSKTMFKHAELGGRDLLGETVALARKSGVKTIAYIPVGHGLPKPSLESLRPEWLFTLDDGLPPKGSLHFGGPEVLPVCTFGAYRKAIMKVVEEIVSGYDIDGVYIDGPYQGWIFENLICQCDSCKAAFAEDSGMELPSNAELHAKRKSKELEARISAHASFVASGLAELMSKIGAAASARKLPLLFNACAMEYLGAEAQTELTKLANGFLVESSMGGIKGIGKGLYHRKTIWNYTHAHSCWPRRSDPEIEAGDELSALLSVAQGATPIVSYAGRFLYDSSFKAPVARTFKYMASLEAAVSGSKPVAHGAIVCPCGLRSSPSDKSVLSFSELLGERHVQRYALPREALLDKDALSNLSFAVLPSFESLSEDEAANLVEFVKAGGGVLATGRGLADAAFASSDAAKALSSLFGVAPAKPSAKLSALMASLRWDQAGSDPWDCYLKCRDGIFAGHALSVGDYAPVEALEGSETLAEIAIGGDSQGSVPGIVRRRLGKGWTVYVPSSLEEVAWRNGEILLKALLASLCATVSRLPQPCELDAPKGVFSNLFERKGSLLLHLVDKDMERASTTLAFSLRLPGAPASAKRLSDGSALDFEFKDGVLSAKGLTLRRKECIEISLK